MVGKVTYRQLCDLGIKRIRTVQEMPVEMMSRVFGKNGEMIWKKANGIDPSPVVQYSERKSISKETTFAEDVIDPAVLRDLFGNRAGHYLALARGEDDREVTPERRARN